MRPHGPIRFGVKTAWAIAPVAAAFREVLVVGRVDHGCRGGSRLLSHTQVATGV